MRQVGGVVGGALALIVLAGCGSSSSGGNQTAQPDGTAPSSPSDQATSPAAGGDTGGNGAYYPPTPSGGGSSTVSVTVRHTKVGSALALAGGNMLYLWEADKSTSSTCYGNCTKVWPPIIVHGKTQAKGGAKSSLFGTTKRKDGKKQLTYNGHPLYTYAGDHSAKSTKGQNLDSFGADWYVVAASGDKIE